MLAKGVHYLLSNPQARQTMAAGGEKTLNDMRGALKATIRALEPYINPLTVKARLAAARERECGDPGGRSMVSEAPPFWWRRPGIQSALLSPFGWLYGRVARRIMEKRVRTAVDAAVICVGNFTVGGSGKTPRR
jgi:hypothetical protein